MKREIKFNSFYSSDNYTKNLEKLFADYELFRQKYFSNQCIALLKEDYPDSEILLTHSATGALEMIALALDIQEGDEVILPSYTFVSTANAFALRGAKLVFVDIELDTLGIDPLEVEKAITPKTKAIVCVHYAGHACKIEELKKIAERHTLYLIEDAAMAFGSKHKGQALGTIGDFGVVSFDITKHISATQGGMLLINNSSYVKNAYQNYHIGTNRAAFDDGSVPYYEWVSLGSKYQMPESNAAILYGQLTDQNSILKKLNTLSFVYHQKLKSLENEKKIGLMPLALVKNNYHEFYLLLKNEDERKSLSKFLAKKNIEALFHYIPLHRATFGKNIFESGTLAQTDHIAHKLLRLPLHCKLGQDDIEYVCSQIKNFFRT
jgi:dTDP-4-amino-4,6-dideoxygalactose transaminase